MMTIMYSESKKSAASRKQQTHERIVEVASPAGCPTGATARLAKRRCRWSAR
ncbi:hypothetical protein JOD97_004999 [Duganella sp. 1411]|nr:hypothetical protein [Duganella sp. 1411]